MPTRVEIPGSFTLPNETRLRLRTPKSVIIGATTLNDIRDRLMRMQRMTDPRDVTVPLSKVGVYFVDGRMCARFADTTGKPMLISTNGANHMAREVLPPRFWTGFRMLAQVNPKRAQGVWDDFSKFSTRDAVVRLNNHVVQGEVRTIIRAVVSERYGMYANISMVQDILDAVPDLASLPVVDCWMTDNGIRIRFLVIDAAMAALSMFDPDVLKMGYIPMIEISNSEVGCGTVSMVGGAYNVQTQEGLGHWDETRRLDKRHLGQGFRFTEYIQETFKTFSEDANDIVQSYQAAREVDLEDPVEWLRDRLGMDREVPERVIEATIAALDDPLVTPGRKLASIVDAMTIAAGLESDIYTAKDVEAAAARLLKLGSDIAAKNGGLIKADVTKKKKEAKTA